MCFHCKCLFSRADSHSYSLTDGVQVAGGSQVDRVFNNRRSREDLLAKIAPGQDLKLLLDLNDRNRTTFRDSNELVSCCDR